MKDEPAAYVYCAVRSRRRPALRRSVRGLPAAGPPHPVSAGDGLWLIVSAAPLAVYGADPITERLQDLDWVSRRAMAHEAVVEDAARSGPVVPMKLFTLFSSEDRAVAHVERSRSKLERLFDLVAGRQEWGVRVSIDEREAARRRARTGARVPSPSGTGFLLRKKAEKDAARVALEEALRDAERVFGALGQLAVDARRRTPVQSSTGVRVLLDAAFLVSAKRGRRFRGAVAALARECRENSCAIALSGPWPPYNFVSESA